MVTGYLILKWLHVMAAAFLIGAVVTDGLLSRLASRAKDLAARTFAWNFLVKGEKVAIPTAVVLLLSGLAMVFGPFAGGWSLTRDLWVLLGIVLFFVLLALMAGVAGGAAKKTLAAYAGGHGEAVARPHETRFAAVALVGFVLVAFVVFLMVAKPF